MNCLQMLRANQTCAATQSGSWNIRFAYELAFDEEVARSISGDTFLVAIAFILILAATVLTQSFRNNPFVSSAMLGRAWPLVP
jgi:hypothetical protein